MRSYLDYNATAPLRPEVVGVMREVLAEPLNASSVHAWGRRAKKRLEEARAVIASALSCFPAEVIFTGSGTEANHLALSSFAGRRMAVSAVEHVSVLKALPQVTVLPVTPDGVLRHDALRAWLKQDTAPAFVSVMSANNETGVLHPLRHIAELVHEHDGVLHCDAAQAFGKIPVDMGVLGADMLTLSAHKMGGPQGAAALVVRQGTEIAPRLSGGGQESGRRAGTENLAALCGFAEAVRLAQKDDWQKPLRAALALMEAALLEAVPDAAVLGQGAQRRLPNTSAILMPGIAAEVQLMHFDLEGIGVSAGSACSSGKVTVSHVARAMGFSEAQAGCVIRVSGGWNTKLEDIERFTQSWLKLANRVHIRPPGSCLDRPAKNL